MSPLRRAGAGLAQIEAVYRSRFHEYGSVAAAILNDREAGRDAVQEAFASAVRRRGDFEGRGSLEAWLWRAVVNAALSELRRRKARVPERFPDVADASSGHLTEGDVRDAIARLPERQRLVLFLRYYADLDYRAIADALGIAPGTVGAALHAARSAVQRHLEEVPT
jgi:RNA polymerase sigma factor (sigma-70 family)